MWYLAYNILLILASPLILLTLLAKKRCRRGLLQRFGFLPAGLLRPDGPGTPRVVWVHAVSLGEVVAVAPLVRQLHHRYPDWRFVISTVTETGREAVEQRLGDVAVHCYAPLDFPWVVSRVVERLSPSAYLFVETELWPNLLRALAKRSVKAILVNGRLSSRSFERYLFLKPFMREVLAKVTLCLMQTERDAERIIALGADPARVVWTGNIKFDQPLPGQSAESLLLSREAIGVGADEELIVAGSTHPGEEEQILASYAQLREEFPSLVLLLAPRHIERASQLEEAVKAKGLVAVRRTSLGKNGADTVHQGHARGVILDTRGELAGVYRHAVVSFVGGTLVPVGGHNLLEPAGWGKPVFFGPHTDHCAEVAHLLLQAGAAVRVRDGQDLGGELRRSLRDRQVLQCMGQAARVVVAENRGAAERTLAHVSRALDSHGSTARSMLSNE
jgi:3-deoxy-D-manno-octulosonic-acid transferase